MAAAVAYISAEAVAGTDYHDSLVPGGVGAEASAVAFEYAGLALNFVFETAIPVITMKVTMTARILMPTAVLMLTAVEKAVLTKASKKNRTQSRVAKLVAVRRC